MVYKAERTARKVASGMVCHVLRSWSLRCRWHEEATQPRLTGAERSLHSRVIPVQAWILQAGGVSVLKAG